ncbi:exodeoxyribonuclease III [Geopsychrobacter electrodiphilus]|uniref:exodeoxyribonuclease III n=1 Tax=Geopsychrobacter electrodiphilus TaxID=225196 RepID=UPI00037F0AD2|nr:exodeoxyribonuclease III [Geopsychrobacter electrodiphilus]
MKIVSFNVNGLRARFHQLQALIDKHQPDIIGLQEIKVNDPDFPLDVIGDLGYQVVFHGQKTHYGVALMSKITPEQVQKGFAGEEADHQRRVVLARYPLSDGRQLRVVNGYFPQGESREHPTKFPDKRKFYANLQNWLETQADPQDLLVVMGDLNISPEDLDIGIGDDNAKRWLRTGKCSFLPEERQWLQGLKDWGLIDSFRERNPAIDDRFSWFDYRSRGFEAEPKRGLRIDLIMATAPLMEKCRATGIDYELRGMERPSDHCPIWAEFDL